MDARRTAVLVAPLAVLLGIASAAAPSPVGAEPTVQDRADATVRVVNLSFSPSSVSVGPGDTVTWSFEDKVTHNSTSFQGFWSSGPRNAGGSYSREFTSAGSFSYFCTIHGVGMRGTVKVRILASGSPTEGWSLRWATVAGTDTIDYDVQVKKPGSKRWTAFRTDTGKRATNFLPAKPGRYAFRARTARDGNHSGWSPTKRVTIE